MVSTGLFDALATGLVTGSIIAAGALGLSLIYSIAEVPNFAHGDIITIGAYLALVFNKPAAIPFLPDSVPLVGTTSLAVAGVLAGWSASNVNPNMGFSLLLPVFAAVIMGGIRSPYGSALAGLLIGFSMDLGVYVLPSGLAVYREAIAFVILIAVLLVRPEGI